MRGQMAETERISGAPPASHRHPCPKGLGERPDRGPQASRPRAAPAGPRRRGLRGAQRTTPLRAIRNGNEERH